MSELVPPPPKLPKRRKKRGMPLRPFVWGGGLVVGAGLGFAAYQLLPAVAFYFDYWAALLFA